MQRPIAVIVTLLALLNCLGAAAQTTAPSPTERKILIQRILAGDGNAIREAGLSKDRAFVEPLKQIHEKTRRRRTTDINHGDFALDTTVALAKLGETGQQQELWCLLGIPAEYVSIVTNELSNTGGWYAIQGLQSLLNPEVMHQIDVAKGKWFAKHNPGDAAYDTEADYRAIVQALLKIAPTRPPQARTDGVQLHRYARTEAKLWDYWIDEHREEWNKLEPTGEGVGFSASACKDGKPRKK